MSKTKLGGWIATVSMIVLALCEQTCPEAAPCTGLLGALCTVARMTLAGGAGLTVHGLRDAIRKNGTGH